MKIYNEKFERWSLLWRFYFVKLDHLYKNGIITNDQYKEERDKLYDGPSDTEENIKYLEHLHEDLNVYFKSTQS